ncbi:hypothetical protein FRC10_006499 [Ceratobasidium sp. 414]|nr:hypothetical protein FRC10_006499 [Ceratobasidium sp. 414]
MPDSSISPPDMLVQLQLGLFAGQVYFDSYSQYRAVCAFLGIFVAPDSDQAAIQVQSDGFVKESDRSRLAALLPEYRDCRFSNSPVSTLKELVGYRRKGMEYLRTHMGQLLHARPLLPDDF